AVHREQPVIDVGADEIALRGRKLQANQGRGRAADEEEQRDGGEVENGDALVIGGEKPRAQPVIGGEVILRLVAHRPALVAPAKDLMGGMSRTRSSSPILPANEGMTGA